MHTFDHCAHVADYYAKLGDSADECHKNSFEPIYAKFCENYRNLEADYRRAALNAEEVA